MKDIRSDFRNRMNNIPYFIDSKKPTHKLIWTILFNINDIYYSLIREVVLNDNQIEIIIEKYNILIDDLYKIEISNDLSFELILYEDNIIKYLTKECLDNEEYETLANISKFTKQITTNLIK